MADQSYFGSFPILIDTTAARFCAGLPWNDRRRRWSLGASATTLAAQHCNHEHQRCIVTIALYPRARHVAIAAGVVLTGVEVFGSVSYLTSQNSPSYLVLGGAIVTAVAAMLPVLAAQCWAQRRYLLSALLWAATVPALSLIVCAAVERTGSNSDQANRDRQALANRIELARSAEREAKVTAAADEAAAMAECASGRKAKCLGLEARADQSRQRLEAAREAVAKAGVVPTDPMASRIAAVLPVSEAAVQLYQPLILPLSISALGLLLIAAGAHHPQQAPKAERKRAGKRKRRRRKVLPQPSPSNVIRLRKA